jgi:RNA-directed DNA polymerase
MLEEILNRRNIERALKQVETNKGASGIDGMRCNELRPYINKEWQTLRTNILEDKYRPSPVRKVEIDKAGGGKRMLGIPTVRERMLQQAIAQWLEPRYDPGFSKSSYGYRPGRSAHQAILKARDYLNEGKSWVIEMDLAQFFDRINHDKLMGKLRKEIADKATLKLIRQFLTCGIMEGGLVSPKNEGMAQGSPLSPILSNIVLDDLDKELEKRGHSFVRYADDISVYVSSEVAAKRVMEGMIRYVEEELKLKVNREKTKIGRPHQSTLLGFSFYRGGKFYEPRVSEKSLKKIKEKCKEITKRSNGLSEEMKIKKLSPIVRGWANYFTIAKAKRVMEGLDRYVRTRLRVAKWKQWKNRRTRAINLRKLGINRSGSYNLAYSSKGYCRIADSPILKDALSNGYFQKQGYVGFLNIYHWKNEKQLKLF